jgi:hypothetical protein
MSQAFAGSMPRLLVIGQADYEPVSDGSKTLQRLWEEDRNYLRGSAADWSPIIGPALWAIKHECEHDDWDGEGARPVSDRTITLAARIAECLFELLPRDTPAPDLIAEPDGEICMTWGSVDERLFALSIGERGKINYAGQFGEEGARHGWQPIDATSRRTLEASLEEIAVYIGRVFKRPAIRRAA